MSGIPRWAAMTRGEVGFPEPGFAREHRVRADIAPRDASRAIVVEIPAESQTPRAGRSVLDRVDQPRQAIVARGRQAARGENASARRFRSWSSQPGRRIRCRGSRASRAPRSVWSATAPRRNARSHRRPPAHRPLTSTLASAVATSDRGKIAIEFAIPTTDCPVDRYLLTTIVARFRFVLCPARAVPREDLQSGRSAERKRTRAAQPTRRKARVRSGRLRSDPLSRAATSAVSAASSAALDRQRAASGRVAASPAAAASSSGRSTSGSPSTGRLQAVLVAVSEVSLSVHGPLLTTVCGPKLL